MAEGLGALPVTMGTNTVAKPNSMGLFLFVLVLA